MDCKTTPTLAEAVRAESVTSLIGRAAAGRRRALARVPRLGGLHWVSSRCRTSRRACSTPDSSAAALGWPRRPHAHRDLLVARLAARAGEVVGCAAILGNRGCVGARHPAPPARQTLNQTKSEPRGRRPSHTGMAVRTLSCHCRGLELRRPRVAIAPHLNVRACPRASASAVAVGIQRTCPPPPPSWGSGRCASGWPRVAPVLRPHPRPHLHLA